MDAHALTVAYAKFVNRWERYSVFRFGSILKVVKYIQKKIITQWISLNDAAMFGHTMPLSMAGTAAQTLELGYISASDHSFEAPLCQADLSVTAGNMQPGYRSGSSRRAELSVRRSSGQSGTSEAERTEAQHRTLLTVSTVIDDDIELQIAQQMRPRVDYLEMAQVFDADLIDYAAARRSGGRIGKWLEKLGGPNLTLAWATFLRRHDYDVIFTDGEQVGIPLAWFCRLSGVQGAHHLMITHILSVYKKMFFLDLFGLQRYINTFLVYSTWQKHFIETRWGVQPERVAYTPFMVDTKFFSPDAVTPNPRHMISSAGLECRDYPTLIKVAFNLDVQVVIAAGSPFSKRRDTTENLPIPANVSVNRLTQYELRQLYADSLFVVVPLYNVDFQAGVTVILEAMAMEKAVICSGTPGQTDVVIDGKTGLYVPAEDPAALQKAIEYLLANPEIAEEMGKAGRQLVDTEMSLDCYTERLNRFVQRELEIVGRENMQHTPSARLNSADA